MTRLTRALEDLSRSFADLGARWALVGGMAVSVRTEPRFTRDVDVAVAVADDAAAEDLIFQLVQRGYQVVGTVEQDRTGRLSTARLMPPGEKEGGLLVDLLFASNGIEPELVTTAEILEVGDQLRVPVASVVHLLVAKTLARDDKERPQDALDIAGLVREMGPDQWTEAIRAARLVQSRGFARGRHLVDDIEALKTGTEDGINRCHVPPTPAAKFRNRSPGGGRLC